MAADARYDVVVVGGGHHGTIIACYLARAGLKVGAFERRGLFGGGATSGRGSSLNCFHVMAADLALRT